MNEHAETLEQINKETEEDIWEYKGRLDELRKLPKEHLLVLLGEQTGETPQRQISQIVEALSPKITLKDVKSMEEDVRQMFLSTVRTCARSGVKLVYLDGTVITGGYALD